MHEWALAEGVVSTALRVADQEGLEEVTEITVRIGELQQIEHDIFMFALEQLRKGKAENAKFVLESTPGKFRCRVCGEEWEFSPSNLQEDVSEAIHFIPEMAHVYIKCPSCESPDFEVTEGRGVTIASIKGLKRDD